MRPRYLIAPFCLALALAASSVSNAATLTFSTPSCSDFTVSSNNGNVTLNCVPVGGGTGAPTGCSLTASTNSLGAGGGAVTLTAACSGGGAPTSYGWTGGTLTTSTTTGQQTTNITSTTTFSVTPSNGSGAGNTAQTTVTVGGGGGGGGTDLCSGYTSVVNMDVPWGGVNDTRSNGTPFTPSAVLVVRFTVPAGAAYNNASVGAVTVSEFSDPPVWRQASLSTQACDFRGVAIGATDKYTKDITGQLAYPLQWGAGNTATTEFTVTGTSFFPPRPQLQPGQTYYFNVRNWNPFANGQRGDRSCLAGTCNVIVHVSTP